MDPRPGFDTHMPMASFALIQGLSGIRYDAVTKTLHIAPKIKGDFKAFICTATGFGNAGVRDGKPFANATHGRIDVDRLEYHEYKSP